MKPMSVPALVTNRLLGVAWVIVLAFLFVLAIDSFIGSLGMDQPIFMYVAKGMLQGEVPYLHRWDHKGPLLYLLNAAGLIIDETWGMQGIQGFFLLSSVWISFAMLRKVFGLTPTLFALAMFFIYFSKFVPPGNFAEQFGLLFQFLTLYLFVRSEDQDRPDHSQVPFALLHMSIGVLGAGSFLLRPNLVALWIALGIYWVIMRGTSLHRLIWAVAGGGTVLILVAAFFKSLGALGALWDAVFVFNFAYSDATFSARLGVVRQLVGQFFPISLLVIAGWCLGIVFIIRRRLPMERLSGLIVISLILLPLEVVSLSLADLAFPHYFLTILPVVMLLMGFIISFVLTQRLVAPSLMSVALLLGAAYFVSPLSRISHLADKYVNAVALAGPSQSPQNTRHRNLIQQSTRPDDTILVWGRGAWLHIYSDRDAPTRYFYDVPLTKPNYTTQAMLDEFLSEVKEQMPKLIIDMKTNRFPPLAEIDRPNWRPWPRAIDTLEVYEPFLEFVEANYLAVDSTPPYTFYALKLDNSEVQASHRGELIIRSFYDVYLDGRTLTYVRRQCANDDAGKRFILHVIPVDKDVIGGNEQHTMDFSFIEGKDWYVGEDCVVSRELPDYAISYIRTGQYSLDRTHPSWLSEYQFSTSN